MVYRDKSSLAPGIHGRNVRLHQQLPLANLAAAEPDGDPAKNLQLAEDFFEIFWNSLISGGFKRMLLVAKRSTI